MRSIGIIDAATIAGTTTTVGIPPTTTMATIMGAAIRITATDTTIVPTDIIVFTGITGHTDTTGVTTAAIIADSALAALVDQDDRVM